MFGLTFNENWHASRRDLGDISAHLSCCIVSFRYILGGRDETESDPAFWVAAYKGHTLQVTPTTAVTATTATMAHAACLPGCIGLPVRAGCADRPWAAVHIFYIACMYAVG